MRVLLLSQYFWPDLSAAAQLASDLTQDLTAKGVQLSVITGRQAYAGGTEFAAHERWQGVDIHRVTSSGFGRDRLLGRAIDHASFLAAAGVRTLVREQVDVVVATSTPPFISLLGLANKRLTGSKFVYWVHDLYPDIAVELGVLARNGPAALALEKLSRKILHSADAVIAIGECMAQRIAAKGIPASDITVIHNWADGDAIREVSRADNWFRAEHGLQDKFVVLYSGNMGRGHEFETLLDAARALADRPDILFLFIGGGARRGEVQRAARTMANVRLLPYQPRDRLAWTLGAADLAVVTLRSEAVGLMVPSKLYGHLASARPLLFIGPAESAVGRIIVHSRSGAVCAPGDRAGVVSAITATAADPVKARAMGHAGRRWFDDHSGRGRSTDAFLAVCRSLIPIPADLRQKTR